MGTYNVAVNGTSYAVVLKQKRGTTVTFAIEGEEYTVNVNQLRETRTASRNGSTAVASAAPPIIIRALSNEIRSPLPGIVSEVKVNVGQSIEVGATVLVIEAMKMENAIRASRAGIVEAVHVTKGQEVGNSALLVTFEKQQ